MKFVIHTQYMENYGYTWKYKGGRTVIITDCPELSAEEQDNLQAIADKKLGITYTEEGSKEYIISSSLHDDDWLSSFEQDQLFTEGEIRFKDPRYSYLEITQA